MACENPLYDISPLSGLPNPEAEFLTPGPIGVFDSGYGGLTILRDMIRRMPEYDYLYLGDNARAPYGTRSFDVIYDFTRQSVEELFKRGCNLVILACNTASAKALRSIQQLVLPGKYPGRRVLGVIRPTIESLASISASGHVGLLATQGTVRSHSYQLELAKTSPSMKITETECPMFVPLVEANEFSSPGADYFVKKYLSSALESDPLIDTLVLGCTHYPLLLPKILQYAPEHIRVMTQGGIVANSLADYLTRHPEIERVCTRGSSRTFLTTESSEKFNRLATLFLEGAAEVESSRITL